MRERGGEEEILSRQESQDKNNWLFYRECELLWQCNSRG